MKPTTPDFFVVTVTFVMSGALPLSPARSTTTIGGGAAANMGRGYRTAASPSMAFTSAKKSGTGWTRYPGPSSITFGPFEVKRSR